MEMFANSLTVYSNTIVIKEAVWTALLRRLHLEGDSHRDA
jgi:hypothetical protein